MMKKIIHDQHKPLTKDELKALFVKIKNRKLQFVVAKPKE